MLNEKVIPSSWILFLSSFQKSTKQQKEFEDFLDEWSSELEVCIFLANEQEGAEVLAASKRILRRMPLRQLLVFLTFILIANKEKEYTKYFVYTILESDQRVKLNLLCSKFDIYQWFEFIERYRVSVNPDYMYAVLNNKIGRNKAVATYSLIKPFIRRQRQPATLVRRRGYTDHGSLGSSRSGVIKSHSGDWSLMKKEKERKQKQELLERLHLIIFLRKAKF